MNKQISPAFFSEQDVAAEIQRLSARFHTVPQIYRLDKNNLPRAIIATFGGLQLEPLKSKDVELLARGKSPRNGILVDFLNDFHYSARLRLPVYSLGGSGGFAWIANYDQYGKGSLRFFCRGSIPNEFWHRRRAHRPSLPGQVTSGTLAVAMEDVGGVYQVPVRINDTITLNAIVDSGATDVSIPADVVLTLIRTKTLSPEDFLGSQTYILADGSKMPSHRFKIRSLQVGSKNVENVVANIASVDAQILLGQSFLSRFSLWSIDNVKHILILN